MDNCITHEGTLDRKGYGRVWSPEAQNIRFAHRIAYVEAHGLRLADIQGQVVRHACDNPACVNPDHLLLGTQAENIRDMDTRGRRAKDTNNSKFDQTTIDRVFELREQGLLHRQIASQLGMSRSHVSSVLGGVWRARS